MKRRQFLKSSAGLGLWAAFPMTARRVLAAALPSGFEETPPSRPLRAPSQGSIPVAFLISDGAVVIDFCGPWEVFQDAAVAGRMDNPFQLYTVAASTKPVRTSAGMKIVPEYTFQNAPPPKVVVIPAQGDKSEAPIAWLRKTAQSADVIMSVCTGAFLLARTGLLDGKSATTHHSGFRQFAMDFPKIQLQRGARYVDNGGLATAGGLSSGIDLALHVVERYFGREAAENTAYYMEYQGEGWKNPKSNAVYATARLSTSDHPLCAVCEMDVDPKTAPKSVYKGRNYYFCSDDHKKQFDAAPAGYVQASAAK